MVNYVRKLRLYYEFNILGTAVLTHGPKKFKAYTILFSAYDQLEQLLFSRYCVEIPVGENW
jgi:hypothetical protein